MKEKPKTKTEKVAKYMPLMYIIPLVLFIISGAIIIIVKESGKKVSPDEVVAKVNGYSITAEELSDRMSAEKAYIIEQYKEKEIDDDFWNTEINGVTPLSKLQNRALEVLTKVKVEQQIAVENKIIDKNSVSYSSILNAMENENNLRSQKIAAGQPVYGAKKYTKNSYFTYYYSNLQLDNKKKLGEKGGKLYADDKKVKAWYESVKDEKYPAFDTYKLTVYQLDLENSNIDQKNADDIMNKVKSALESKKSYEYIKKNICKDIQKFDNSVNEKNASDVQKTQSELFNEIQNLKSGSISKVINENNKISVVVCNLRKDGGYKSFKTYKSGIYNEYIAEKYESFVQDRVSKAKVEKTDKFQYVK